MGNVVFGLACVLPALLTALSAAAGGGWIIVAVLAIWLFKSVQAPLAVFAATEEEPDDPFPASDELALVLAALHLFILGLGLWAIAGPSGMNPVERLGILLLLALFFGQIAHFNALALIRHSDWKAVVMGRALMTTLLYGHYASAWPLVHQPLAATDADPMSAGAGEDFASFAPRALAGSFAAGRAAAGPQPALLPGTPKDKSAKTPRNPYAYYMAGAVLALVAAFAIAGIGGVFTLVVLAALVQLQLLLSAYLRHYGLRRAVQENGKLEPLGPQHVWSSRGRLAEAWMLFALRLADRKELAQKRFADWQAGADQSPTYPHSRLTMSALALVPSKWHDATADQVAALQPGAKREDPFERLAKEGTAESAAPAAPDPNEAVVARLKDAYSADFASDAAPGVARPGRPARPDKLPE